MTFSTPAPTPTPTPTPTQLRPLTVLVYEYENRISYLEEKMEFLYDSIEELHLQCQSLRDAQIRQDHLSRVLCRNL